MVSSCESEIAIFAWRFSSNYADTSFKIKFFKHFDLCVVLNRVPFNEKKAHLKKNILIIILYYLANVKNILKDVKNLKLKYLEEGIIVVTGKKRGFF